MNNTIVSLASALVPRNLRNVRCYDNGGATADRYTVVFMECPERQPGTYCALGMNSAPFHPQGFGQHTTAMPGRHLGKRIDYRDLPKDCRELVMRDYKEIQASK